MDEVKRLEELMDVYGLKIRIIPLDEEGISEIESETDQLFSCGFDRGRSLRRVRMFFEEQVLYVLKDGFGVWKYFFRLSDVEGETPRVIYIGPFLSDSADRLRENASGNMALTESQRCRLENFFTVCL